MEKFFSIVYTIFASEWKKIIKFLIENLSAAQILLFLCWKFTPISNESEVKFHMLQIAKKSFKW